MKPKKTVCLFLIAALFWGGIPQAEAFLSAKNRGKLTLVGILGGLAYLTHSLVTRDKQATEALHRRLGPPARVVEFEKGFDRWRIEYYRTRAALFRNGWIWKGDMARDFCRNNRGVARDRPSPYGVRNDFGASYRYAFLREPHVVAALPFASTASPSIWIFRSLSVGKRTFAASSAVAFTFDVTNSASSIVASSRTAMRRTVSPASAVPPQSPR